MATTNWPGRRHNEQQHSAARDSKADAQSLVLFPILACCSGRGARTCGRLRGLPLFVFANPGRSVLAKRYSK